MFILLNFSKKIERFNLYTNCFNTLYRDHLLEYLDFSREINDINMDFSIIREKIKSCLTNAGMSVYDLIVLYDFETQQNEPLVYSTTAMLHNINSQIVEKVKDDRYEIECTYFITIDEANRDKNNVFISENLRNSLEFDKKGYITNTSIPHFINDKDLLSIKESIEEMYNKHQKDRNYKNAFDEIDKNSLSVVENRIVKALENNIDINDIWYENSIKEVFKNYRKELKLFFADIEKGSKGIENLSFSLENYLKDNISSYYDIDKNKILRFNMLKNLLHANINEVKFKNYFKLIAIIIYIVRADKKYVFGNSFLSKQNHYTFEVNIEKDTINKMLNDFDSNLKYQLLKLGEVKFNEIDIEEFDKIPIEANIKDENRYDVEKPKFSFLKNDNNIRDVEEYGKKCEDRYVDFVNYINQRLSKTTDKLRVSMLKEFSGKKSTITVNDLFRIIGEKNNQVKVLKERIASNTPDDIIQLDFRVFDEINEKVKKAIILLNQRITFFHMLLNAVIILAISIMIFPLVRRFHNGLFTNTIKQVMWVTPMIIYIIGQFIFCFLRSRKVTKLLVEIDDYTREIRKSIRVDDVAFNHYINDIYELMLLTKYINKLKDNAKNSNIDITNYRHHRGLIEKAIENNKLLARNLRVIITETNKGLVNIPLDIDYNEYENDMYCPLLYVPDNQNNVITINSTNQNKLEDNLLNFVENIELRYDSEVYDERS